MGQRQGTRQGRGMLKRELLQPVTGEILQTVRELLLGARHAALGVLQPKTGHPAVSRVALATMPDITPILLTSALAPHTAALSADPRCSLLVGQIGKGDPMAHPRVTLFCRAEPAPEQDRAALRDRFLQHHPKARNYIDLPDFGFWRLQVEQASFNGGFGKACAISGHELMFKG